MREYPEYSASEICYHMLTISIDMYANDSPNYVPTITVYKYQENCSEIYQQIPTPIPEFISRM